MHRPETAPAEPETTTLPVLLDRIGAELDMLAADLDELQDLLGPALARIAADMPRTVVKVQGLDAIGQTLASLSAFVAGLARSGLPPQPVAVEEIAEALPLSDLAHRLRGRTSMIETEDFELF